MKKILISFFSLLLINTSCNQDDLEKLNINPQAINEIDMNFLFTSAQLGTASGGDRGDNRYIDWRTNMGMFAHAIQHIANVGGGIAPGDKYSDNAEVNSAPWDFLYNGPLQSLTEVIIQTGPEGFQAGQRANLLQASRILRAYNFMRLTDYYGNIPYSEAMKGKSEGTFFPKFDSQESIYADLLKEVSEATVALSASAPDAGFANADLYYGGDIAKWKKFGNSLLLRMAMRVSNVDAAATTKYATQAISGGLMTSNADITKVDMDLGPSEWTNQNGISRAFADGDGGQPSPLSATLVNWLMTKNDPRLMILSGGVGGVDTVAANQKGLPNGLDTGTLQDFLGKTGANPMEEFSVINPLLLEDDESYVFMNYSEVEFLLAEAAERGIGGASDAAGHYAKGVKAAIQQYDLYDASFVVSDEVADAYIAANPYNGLESIGEQMWVSKFFNWWEAWADWKRTGFPKLTPVNYLGNITNGTIPRKLRIPNSELSTNPDNFQSGATLPNEYTTRVWWDVK
ncbi:SusD/RagB family nutrient-binding outer membrane lipoprotein [Arcticibacterium luteifluviistationis]|uniref:SusD/RagB family nutrient-binding outer membrane lipoprotein n=1 Tax=Arcticibacterium luteifluviistationis TaxID=1784714 RepID=A0A2Z4GDX6_9BACT|nr:SusD/RagB family nutrient-binding outer membrane lipoprotein [Arcticibacterium luteifluviistationis]AWV99351.1 SusD/RagB family nutrient-binding outer membrane lipoprotein [Arcticibacterium luteifluviistationis]